MIYTGNLGYPRIGKKRELKFALEKYWNQSIPIDDLRTAADTIIQENIADHKMYGIDFVPIGDFSLYDHVLDQAIMVGAIPDRFIHSSHQNQEDLLFSMARGKIGEDGQRIPAMEMTKWFNTNYHYIVPEINESTQFSLNPKKLISEIDLANENGVVSRPVILGPVSFLSLSKSSNRYFQPLSKLPELLPIYEELFEILHKNNIEWIQFDEPSTNMDLNEYQIEAYKSEFSHFADTSARPKIMLTSYFADLSLNFDLISKSPFEGLHIDLTETEAADEIISRSTEISCFSLGIINGRNIWLSNMEETVSAIIKYASLIGERDIILSPSCSMLHLPLDINLEDELDPDVRSWMAFAEQKLEGLSMLKGALAKDSTTEDYLAANRKAFQSRKESLLVHLETDLPDLNSLSGSTTSRVSPFPIRKVIQRKELHLPLLPTTTIGSFPQTNEVRSVRSKFNKGLINEKEYFSFLENEILKTILIQEELELDVLVHGEFERNDMVQYFAEKLSGFAFTKNGWVQSFGSRCVRPPIIFGDVTRPEPMTVKWIKFAQSKTQKHVKGMLTGPVTILQWSFVRDDQPKSETCKQIAFAIRAEVEDLEKANTKIIQIDEPALREGLPIQKNLWKEYLEWAVKCFKIASSSVQDKTQIHTHMCYAEFNDIIDAIIDMDADVISIEASRSKMELLDAFHKNAYPNDIGPGIYDIHSPNIPSKDELVSLIEKALEVIPKENFWVNPDCGLKTRNWEEVRLSLKNMVTAAKSVREMLN